MNETLFDIPTEVDPADVRGNAWLSEDGLYRYSLTRVWGSPARLMYFVMLNPSTADASVDDPTIRRCMGFARRDGWGGIAVVNLYAFRATKPADLWKAADPIGGRNDTHLQRVLGLPGDGPVVAAWGANAKPDRVEWLKAQPGAERLRCLGVTKDGAPRHPLYLRSDAELTPWPTPTPRPVAAEQTTPGTGEVEHG